ncbi:MAG: BatD family protein [Candidatus Riflebacteria bacterium]|nr:BatD family protein [Candidatus Riflebacteria bacterium]
MMESNFSAGCAFAGALRTRFAALVIIFLLILLIGPQSALQAADFSIDAQVDRTEVKAGESLHLTITISQNLSALGGRQLGMPRISSIPDFDITGQRSAQNMSFVNGAGVVQVSLQLELVPKHEGTLKIPSLSVQGPDGKTYSTKTITVTARPPSEAREENEKADAASESGAGAEDQPAQSQGVGFFRGLMILGMVVALVLGGPFLLSWLMNRDRKSSSKWQEKDKRDKKEDYEEEPETVVPQPVAQPVLLPVDFDPESEALKRMHPDADADFYRKYFDLFRRSIISSGKGFESNMTPDELLRALEKRLSPDIAACSSRLASDWSMAVFARMAPLRNFADIQSDVRAVLASIRHL